MTYMDRNQPLSETSNDYHRLPVTEKQLRYARDLAARAAVELPREAIQDRRAMSAWIETQRTVRRRPAFSGPSSRQVAFAERIARIKRRQVPPECFRDRTSMSRWIDSNR